VGLTILSDQPLNEFGIAGEGARATQALVGQECPTHTRISANQAIQQEEDCYAEQHYHRHLSTRLAIHFRHKV
jgi:hypothetical protein